MKKCLYKLDASLRLREWCAWAEHFPNQSSVFVRYGTSGGSPIFQRYNFDSSSNSPSYFLIHQPRAGTPQIAAELELKSMIEYQVNRKGYTEKIPIHKPYRPMLAKVYQNNKFNIPSNVYIQPKLNGIRCLGSSKWLVSRTDEKFTALPHIEEALSKLPDDVVLDGELYMNGSSLQEIMGAVRRYDANDTSPSINYHVFDIVDETLSFSKRFEYLEELFKTIFNNSNSIKIVDTLKIPSTEIDEHYNYFLSKKYEGAMIRIPDAPYEINVRSVNLLKYKPRQIEHFRIWDVKPMKKVPYLGILELEGPNGHFPCSIKGTEYYRAYLLKNAASFRGRLAQVEFEDYSDDNTPLKAVCINII